jgi:SprT protein
METATVPERGEISAPCRSVLPEVEQLRAQAKALLLPLGAQALSARLVIRWNPRLRNTAGMAFPGRALITLNPKLAQFGEEEIDRTFRHELAHLLAQERAGRRRIDPHGKEWKQACVDLGLAGEKRSHDLPLPRHRVAPRHFYRCPGCGFELKRVRPLKRHSACVKCCRTHNRGRYDARFRFVAAAPPVPPTDH